MKPLRSVLAVGLVVAAFSIAFRVPALADQPAWIVRGTGGIVASDSPEASQIGARVLARGGNAFDAAIATSFALSVARPQSTGLGGGGFMVAYVAKDKRCVALDFRETAPVAATAERYARLRAAQADGPSPTVYGGNAVAVPGQLAGLAEIQRRFATRPLRELIEPAIRLAETGFLADEDFCAACRGVLADCEKWPQLRPMSAQLCETLLGNGTPPKPGDKIARPDLASGLALIASLGPDAVYNGPIGRAIIRAVEAAGGELTQPDLAGYRVRERDPLRSRWGEFEVVTMPPPSSGGVCIIETLNILQAATDRSDILPGHGPHVLVEALKHAFADRARWLGDPDFGAVPVTRLTSLTYAIELSHRIKDGRTFPPEQYGGAAAAPDGGTSHFCVADRAGNVVALTETVNGPFGSLLVAGPYGLVLNNEMDDFTAEPGRPNLYGLVQGEANAIAPGKRPLSSMSPTIVFREGRPVLVLGGSGGPRIITSVLHVLLNVLERGMSLEQAISAVRTHHQWLPDEVYFDRDPPAELAQTLTECGHKLSDRRKGGVVQAIQLLEDGTRVGASDPHKGGRPAAE